MQPTHLPSVQISEMSMADYADVRKLLESTSGVTFRAADSRQAVERYLARNPGLSFIAKSESRLVGCVFCGHDGRRGYLQHLAVDPNYRGCGIGRQLVQHCVAATERLGIEKLHIDVVVENQAAQEFWQHLGWSKRDDIFRYSFTNSQDSNV